MLIYTKSSIWALCLFVRSQKTSYGFITICNSSASCVLDMGVGVGVKAGRHAISQVPHLVYAEPFLFYANVISAGRNEKVVMQDNYQGTPETGGGLTVEI